MPRRRKGHRGWPRTSLTAPYYDNIKMLSPDGILMCRLSERRVNWYLDRGLAVREGEGIRLTFEPHGLGVNGHPFYTQVHANVCVVCGEGKDLSRHHCVPLCFRKHFPDDYKVHNWFDIVLLCADCHNHYESMAHLIKLQLLHISEDELRWRKDVVNAHKLAHTLIKYAKRIPADKQVEMRLKLSNHLGVDEVTDAHLAHLASLSRTGLHCVEDWKGIVDAIENLDDFVREWRSHFVETMKPTYLPQGWTIDAPTSRSAFETAMQY